MLLKILFEIFLVVRFSGMSIWTISNSFLIQDKFCRNVYNQSELFCQKLNDKDSNLEDFENIRDKIFASTAEYSQYQNAIEFFPMIVWSLFVGSFLDKARNSTKWLLLLHIVTEMFQLLIYSLNEVFFEWSPYYMLIGSVPQYFSGGMTTFLTTAYRYVILISNERTRRIRLMLIMFALTVGMSIGQFGGGQLLMTNNLKESHTEMRTYWENYVSGFILDSFSIVLLFLTIKYVKKDEDYDSTDDDEERLSGGLEADESAGDSSSITSTASSTLSQGGPEPIKGNIFTKIFDIENVKQTVACILKPRAQFINFQIYTIYATYFLMYFVYLGMQNVSLQFCEKVYGWSSAKLATVGSISMVVTTVTVTLSVIIFIKRLKFRDSLLIVVTLGLSSLSQVLIGSFLSEIVYYAAMPLSATAGLTFVCIRNKLSNMISEEEVGRIFSMMATIESAIPLISSIAYSNMFALLISSYPGAVYHLSGVLYFITMSITIYEQYHCHSF